MPDTPLHVEHQVAREAKRYPLVTEPKSGFCRSPDCHPGGWSRATLLTQTRTPTRGSLGLFLGVEILMIVLASVATQRRSSGVNKETSVAGHSPPAIGGRLQAIARSDPCALPPSIWDPSSPPRLGHQQLT
jgi:hypothetical protein